MIYTSTYPTYPKIAYIKANTMTTRKLYKKKKKIR